MKDEVEWIYYPFKIDKKEDALLFKIEDGFEMRFTKDILSKRVSSTPIELSKNIIEIEVENEDAKIISQIKKIHKFETPADFYVPITQESRDFYESIHSSIISSNLDELLEKSVEVGKHIREFGFPEIPLPITTTVAHFENFEHAVSRSETFPKIPIKRIKFGEAVPETYPNEALDLLKSNLTPEQFRLQNEFYQKFFSKSPISRFRTIADEYEKSASEFKQVMSMNMLKRCVGLHAYFASSGPWRQCWIRFNFDPSLDQDCYKYQQIEMRSKRANFQISQKPEIIMEVSKNKSWYLLNECDPIDGFVSKSLKNFIIYTIDNAGVKEIDKKIEETLDSDFELFEM